MENLKNKLTMAGALFIISILFISSATVMAHIQQKATFSSTKKTITLSDLSRGETELKYYNEENLSMLIGIQGGTGPYIWKTAIRLTQMELSAYINWNLTNVNVAFSADYGCPEIDIRIYIYDKGTPTNPGAIIANDTTYHLDSTGVNTIPLVTPVLLNGHEELWVAVEWTQIELGPDVYYAWFDTLSGPAVDEKGDWFYLNSVWEEFQIFGSDYDGNWGIGAIIEGIPQQPPDVPIVTGPTDGIIGTTYSYTFSSNDPEGNEVYYFIDWGDGNYTDWLGPYSSGEATYANHSWRDRGTYIILVKAKDIYHSESDWSDPLQIKIRTPILIFGNITGGIGGVSVNIKNIGDANATNVNMTIKVAGGLILLGKEKTIPIPNMAVGEIKDVKSTVFGLGKTTILASVTCDEGVSAEQIATGFVFLFFVIRVK